MTITVNGIGNTFARMEYYDSTLLTWVFQPLISGTGGGGSTQVSVTSLAGRVLVDQNSTVWQAQVTTLAGRVLVDQNSTVWQVQVTKASTVARSSVTQSSTSVTLQSSNANRLQWTCVNNPNNGSRLYVKFGVTASTADYDVVLGPLEYYEMPQPVYNGRIDGIWDSTGTGFARTCEWLP